MERTQVRTLIVKDLKPMNKEEIALENAKNVDIRKLATLKIYHQRKIAEIDRDLELLLKDDANKIDY